MDPGQDHEAKPQAGSVYSWSGLASDGQTASDYPLTGVDARSGRFIIRDTPSSPWRFRGDDEAPIEQPANGGWLIMPTATGDPDLLPGSLEWLRWHWGSAYAIWHYAGEGEPWCARRRDGKRGLRAGDAMALRRLIIDDYGADPVPRELPGQAPPYQVPPQL